MVALSDSGKQALDAFASKAANDPKIPSFLFGATTAEKDIYSKGGGYNILNDPSSGEVDEDSTFWICSESKLITHLAALQLIERGKLELETPVSRYLQEFENCIILDDPFSANSTFKPATQAVRVKHLLNFTSGLFYTKNVPMDRQLIAYSAPHDKNDPIGEFFSLIKGDLPGIPLQFEPGTDWVYGWSSDVLGFVVEKATGLPLEEYLKANIFGPLGMKTSFYLTPELQEKHVHLTYRQDDKLELWANRFRLFEHDPTKVKRHFGGVGLYSSQRDYLKLLRHLLQIHAGTASNPILKQETVFGLFEPALEGRAQTSMELFISIFPSHPTGGYQWSTAQAINTKDWPTGRKQGSGFWSGWAGTFHFIDPTTGIAAIFSTQCIPVLDRDVMKLSVDLEKVLYEGLV